jgi:hypothetical protein
MPVHQQPSEQGSSSMAVAALLMSMVFCLPILPLVAIVLAIIVLVRRRSGRGMAIAALVVAPLALIPSVLLLTTDVVDEFRAGFEAGLRGPEAPRDESGRITSRSQVGVDNLEVGDCVLRMQLAADLEAGEVPLGEVTAVPCDEPHRSEVVDVYDLDPDGFKTQRALDRKAVMGCLPAFKEYVGVPYRRSALEIHYYSPDLALGVLAGEQVTCLVSTRRGLTETMLASSNR